VTTVRVPPCAQKLTDLKAEAVRSVSVITEVPDKPVRESEFAKNFTTLLGDQRGKNNGGDVLAEEPH